VKTLKQKVLELTGTFETSTKPPDSYGVSVGDFDGAGMSFGVLQFNLKSKTLQPILKTLLITNEVDMVRIFGTSLIDLEKVLNKPTLDQIQWGASITKGRALSVPWREYFKNLGKLQACQELQLKQAEWYFTKADSYMKLFNLKSERGYALCFDVAVQCGSFGMGVFKRIIEKFNTNPDMLEQEKLIIMVKEKANAINTQWRNDVFLRKMAIATGVGTVHGVQVLLEKDFDITMRDADPTIFMS
jgi:hypothetical protein